MDLAPIVLFTYNRPYHTEKTIEALKKNELSQKSDLIVFLDGPQNKDIDLLKKNNQIQEIIKTVTGFQSVKLIKSNVNKGLGNSIIEGVTKIVNEYGKIIVLEDDMIVGRYFLDYMNTSLNKYELQKEVWHITGYNTISCKIDKKDAFFYPLMDCCAWGTWRDRWEYFSKDPIKLIHSYSKSDIYKFNVDGLAPNKWNQVIGNANGKNNTWAIFWYETIMKNNGLCLAPCNSLVNNIGFDGSGVHSRKKDKIPYNKNIDYIVECLPDNIQLDNKHYNVLKKWYKKYYRKERIREKVKKFIPIFLYQYLSEKNINNNLK